MSKLFEKKNRAIYVDIYLNPALTPSPTTLKFRFAGYEKTAGFIEDFCRGIERANTLDAVSKIIITPKKYD